MRIIAGTWRGRRIEVPPGIRPMQDRERERLFSILGPRIEGARVLDLFAGSGAIGLEALSRGAAQVWQVENGRRVLPILRRNLSAVGAAELAQLIELSAYAMPHAPEPAPGTVNIAVAAPPFPDLLETRRCHRLHTLFRHVVETLLAPDGVFVLEHPAALEAGEAAGLAGGRDTRQTGQSAISFWDAPTGDG